MHHGPSEPDGDAMRRTLAQRDGDDLWIAWLLDWFRWFRGR